MEIFGLQDLLQNQIQKSCRLALPDGLEDLMYDISREVLRAQPANVYAFITDYLAALLVTRENLAVASRLCSEVCENVCHLGLKDELLDLGLGEEDVETVKRIVEKYFASGDVKESNLLTKLMAKTDIAEEMLPEILQAIRRAFLRYQAHNTTVYEACMGTLEPRHDAPQQSSSDSDMDDVTRAARHTMRLYRKTKPSENEMERAATMIQAAYRGYGVRRDKLNGQPPQYKPASKIIRFEKFHAIASDQCSIIYSEDESNEAKNTTFDSSEPTSSHYETPKLELHPSLQFKEGQRLSVSSTSLAGSFLKLPKHVPYSAHQHDHDALPEVDEFETEREGTMIDYTEYDDAGNKLMEAKRGSRDYRPAERATSFHSIKDLIMKQMSVVINESDDSVEVEAHDVTLPTKDQEADLYDNCDEQNDNSPIAERSEISEAYEVSEEKRIYQDSDNDSDNVYDIEEDVNENFQNMDTEVVEKYEDYDQQD